MSFFRGRTNRKYENTKEEEKEEGNTTKEFLTFFFNIENGTRYFMVWTTAAAFMSVDNSHHEMEVNRKNAHLRFS